MGSSSEEPFSDWLLWSGPVSAASFVSSASVSECDIWGDLWKTGVTTTGTNIWAFQYFSKTESPLVPRGHV